MLQDLRIVEISAFVAAPLGGMTMAQLGADVIRIDPIGGGIDHARWPVTRDGASLYWAGLNKAKRSLALALDKPEGRTELDALASALLELDKKIPGEIAWVLRVDGHTDVRPINSAQFKSNWDLSAGRAISVVQYLVSKGVSPQRLVAAGFGEFQPIDPGTTDEAFSKNRRIELKLTER